MTTGDNDYFQLRAGRLLALALKLREKGSIEQADAVAGKALHCLDGCGIYNSTSAARSRDQTRIADCSAT